MSGGSYDYGYSRIDDLASQIRLDGHCDAAPPELRRQFRVLLQDVARAARAIEWNDSGDGDDEETALILKCLNRADDGKKAALELAEALEKQAASLRVAFSELGKAK